jgi:hypothetical protein
MGRGNPAPTVGVSGRGHLALFHLIALQPGGEQVKLNSFFDLVYIFKNIGKLPRMLVRRNPAGARVSDDNEGISAS